MIIQESELDFITRRLDRWLEDGREAVEGPSTARPGGPVRELHIELTHRCDQRCVMCHHWEMPLKDPASVRREMGVGEIKKFIGETKALDGLEVVVLTGGETLLRKDLPEIAGWLARRFPDARLGVLSNLWRTGRVRTALTALREAGAGRVWIGSSLDGLEEAHDEVRGRPGAFKGLLRTLDMMRREFPQTQVSFNFTITPRNHQDLWPAYLLTKKLGVWMGAQLVVNHEGFSAPETFAWTPSELESVREAIDRIMLDIAREEGAMKRLLGGTQRGGLGLWTRLGYWRLLRRYSEKPGRYFKDCLAGERYAMLDPEGELFFCPVNKHRTVGNVREAGFDAVWGGVVAERERDFVRSNSCDCCLNCIMNPLLDRAVPEGLS